MIKPFPLSNESLDFPPAEMAMKNPNGLLAVGGDLKPERMLNAYHSGIFPWFSSGDPILWWSPDPRAILIPDEFHLSRSMKRFHRCSPYQVTLNHSFHAVLDGCASGRQEGTWITPDVKNAWLSLHHLGHAQSIEVWQGHHLVGGMYGMALGQVFCGESMFSRSENASKTALLVFCQHFCQYGGKMIDCQVINPHTASLGAKKIPRSVWLMQLKKLALKSISAQCWQMQQLF